MAGGEQRTVAYLKDGSYFGETALLRAERRNATIIAMGKVEVIQVMKEDFFALVNRDEKFADRFAEEEQKRQPRNRSPPAAPRRSGFVGEAVERGLVKATSALVIHLNVCTRCGNCVKACAELHDGISRLTRHGMLFEAPVRQTLNVLEPLLVTTSCMHCLDPECMIGCPTGRDHARREWRGDHPRLLHRMRKLRAALPLRQHLDGGRAERRGTGQAAYRRSHHRQAI